MAEILTKQIENFDIIENLDGVEIGIVLKDGIPYRMPLQSIKDAKDGAVEAAGKAEGFAGQAQGFATQAEGFKDTTLGYRNQAEGFKTTAQQQAAAALQSATDADGFADDALGFKNEAKQQAEIATQAAIDAGKQQIAIARAGLVEPGKPLLKTIEGLGVKVTTPSAADRDAFVKATRGVYNKWKSQIGAPLVDKAEKSLAAVK